MKHVWILKKTQKIGYKPRFGKKQAGQDSGQDVDPAHPTNKAGVPNTALPTYSVKAYKIANNMFHKQVCSKLEDNSAVIILSYLNVLTLEKTSNTGTPSSTNPFPMQPSNQSLPPIVLFIIQSVSQAV